MATLGYAVLLTTFVVCSYAAAVSVAGARRGSRRLIESGIGAFHMVTALMVMASVLMIHAFVTNDFSIRYVSRYSDSFQPLFFKITSYWGGLDGSIMFWVFLLACFGSLAVHVNRDRHRELIPVCRRGDLRGADVLSVPHDHPQQPVQHVPDAGAAGRQRAEPAAAELLHGHPPAVAVHRLRGDDDSVCVRHGRAHHRPSRRCVAARGAALDDVRVDLPVVRPHARHDLGVRRAGLGRILGMGPGRERRRAAVVHGDGLLSLGDGAGTAQHAARLEHHARHPDVLPHDLRHVHDALGRRAVGALVRRQPRARHDVQHLHGGDSRVQLRPGDLPAAAAAREQRARLVGVARSGVPA